MGIRAIRDRYRRALHTVLAEPAFLYVAGAPNAVRCTVRLHDVNRLIGDIKGTSYDFAERAENTPKVVFDLNQFNAANPTFVTTLLADAEAALVRGAIVRLYDLANYGPLAVEIDNREPVHGTTYTCNVVLLSQAVAGAYAQPDFTAWPPIPNP